jgi:putative transposase
MARLLRVDDPGLWYHLSARGNEQRAVFRDQRDREHFLGLLGEWVERFQMRLHAYVLMDNHYHLLAETTAANLSRAMQWLNVSYSVWFNRRHQRVGHLFQGRFNSVIVDPQKWALALSRYIHLNPVRVGRFKLDKATQRRSRQGVHEKPSADMVQARLEHLRHFRWSSYRAYAGYERPPAWLTRESVLGLGGSDAARRFKDYRQYVQQALREGAAESPWENLVERVVLGANEFIAELRGKIKGTRREQRTEKALALRVDFASVRSVVEKLHGHKWSEFRDRHGDWGRDLALYLGRRHGGLTLRQLAEATGGASAVGVSVAIKRFGQRMHADPRLRQLGERARAQLLNV